MTTTISNRQLDLIQAAGKILTASGVGGLTIKNLAKEMGFAESAVYRHFDSKEAIIVSMLEYLAENMDERLSKVVNSTKSPKENLEALIQNHLNYFSYNPHFVVAVFSDGLMEASEKINAAILRIMQVNVKYLLPLIYEGQQLVQFNPNVPSEDLMHIIMGTFRLHMFKWRTSGFGFDIAQKGQQLMSNLFKIIQPCKNGFFYS
jgi:AcrR family transcriptional regulator